MNWLFDFFLGVCLLAIVPFLLAAYGGHLAAETISEKSKRRRAKAYFWALCVLGVAVALVYQYRTMSQDRERESGAVAAQQKADEAQRSLSQVEQENARQLAAISDKLAVIANKTHAQQHSDAIALKKSVDVMQLRAKARSLIYRMFETWTAYLNESERLKARVREYNSKAATQELMTLNARYLGAPYLRDYKEEISDVRNGLTGYITKGLPPPPASLSSRDQLYAPSLFSGVGMMPQDFEIILADLCHLVNQYERENNLELSCSDIKLEMPGLL